MVIYIRYGEWVIPRVVQLGAPCKDVCLQICTVVAESTRSSPDSFYVLYGGKPFADELATLRDFGVISGSTVDVLPRCLGGVSLNPGRKRKRNPVRR